MDEVLVSREGAVGVITLNRPRAINALSLQMVDRIHDQLEAWAGDDAIAAVLIEGVGERGFCAGGDVRHMREQVLAGDLMAADRFFAHEYAMNETISTCAKPIVALVHGVCMGGGIGIAGHARLRVVADNARFAMPESAIGLLCDVGVNALLARVDETLALAFELSGLPVGVADGLALNLADIVVPAVRLGEVRAAVIAAAGGGETAMRAAAEAFAADGGQAHLPPVAERLASCLEAETAAEVVEALAEFEADHLAMVDFIEVVKGRCPTSLEVILQTHRAARRQPEIGKVLRVDLALASWLARRADFAEGVRAVLVDKDRQPRWNPAKWADVPVSEIAGLIEDAG